MEQHTYILSLESSGPTCSAAISDNGTLLAEYNVYISNYHDKLLAEFVNRLLKDFHLKADDLQAVAVSSGPGSFTGLRIGAAIAKGLCYGGAPKLIAVPTMKALAYEFLKSGRIDDSEFDVVLSSHKDFVYLQSFNDKLEELNEVSYLKLEDVSDNIVSRFVAVCGLPDGLFLSFLQHRIKLSASLISSLANKMYWEEKFTDAGEYVPFYVQEFVVKK